MNPWELWLSEVTQGESARSIASRIAVNRTTVSSWIRSGKPPAEFVFRVAREYGADVFSGLKASGWLTQQDCDVALAALLSQVPTRTLIAELHGRAEGFEESTMTDPNMLV